MSLSSSSSSNPIEMDIATLVRQKEQELRDMNEQRIQHYEEIIHKQSNDIQILRNRLTVLKDDFTYNYQLLQERDKELENLEQRNAIVTKDYQESIQEKEKLQNQLIYSNSLNDTHVLKFTQLEKFYTTEIQRIKESVENSRQQQQEETVQWNEQILHLKRELQTQQTNHEETIQLVRKHLTDAADAAMDIVVRERRKKEEQLTQALKIAEERATDNGKLADDLTQKYNNLTIRYQSLQTSYTEVDQECQQLRHQLLQQKTEAHDTLMVSKKERDEARAARTALIEEYETRMLEAMENIRQAETEFRQQRQRYEHQIEEQHQHHVQMTAETVKMMEERITNLANRLREKEEHIQQITLALQESQAYNNEYRQRYEKIETMLLEKERDTVQNESESLTQMVRLEAELQVANERCQELQKQIDTRAESEAEAKATVSVLNEQIRNLQNEVLSKKVLPDVAQLRINDMEVSPVPVMQSSSAITTRNPLSVSIVSDISTDNSVSRIKDSNLSFNGPSSSTVEPLSTQIGSSVLDQLGIIENDKNNLQVALQKAQEERMKSDLHVQNLEEELRLYKHRNELLECQPKPDHDYHSTTEIQNLQTEIERYREHCNDLEEKCTTFRAVIADMRRNMEDLQNQIHESHQDQVNIHTESVSDDNSVVQALKKQLRDSQAYRSSAEVMLASLSKERDELLENSTRLEEYIGILQEQGTINPNSSDNHIRELLFIRQQLKKYTETITNQRNELRKVHQDLARISGEHVASSPKVVTTADDSTSDSMVQENIKLKRDLQVKSEEILQLLVERDRLLDLSNRLRSSLAKSNSVNHSSSVTDSISQPVVDSSSHITIPIGRIAQLEDALARVTTQNIQLRRDVHLLLDNDRNRSNTSFLSTGAEKLNETNQENILSASHVADTVPPDQGLIGTSAPITRRVNVPAPRNVPKGDSAKQEKSGPKSSSREMVDEGIAALAKSKSRSMHGAVKLRNYAEDLVRENR